MDSFQDIGIVILAAAVWSVIEFDLFPKFFKRSLGK